MPKLYKYNSISSASLREEHVFSRIRGRGIFFFPLVAQVGGVVFSPRTKLRRNSDRSRERETEKGNLFPYGNFALRLVKIFAQMHYPSVWER